MFPWNLFPFNKDTKGFMQEMKPEDIDQYVNGIMKKVFPQNLQGMPGADHLFSHFNSNNNGSQMPNQNQTTIRASVFETHNHVYVRVPINDESWLKQLRLYHTSNQLIIEHIPEIGDKQTYTLPAIVKKKGSTAHFKEGTLEVKIPKNIDMQFTEIDISERL